MLTQVRSPSSIRENDTSLLEHFAGSRYRKVDVYHSGGPRKYQPNKGVKDNLAGSWTPLPEGKKVRRRIRKFCRRECSLWSWGTLITETNMSSSGKGSRGSWGNALLNPQRRRFRARRSLHFLARGLKHPKLRGEEGLELPPDKYVARYRRGGGSLWSGDLLFQRRRPANGEGGPS